MSKKKKTVLLCEDDPAYRLLFRLTLEPRGYEVVEARDGSTAVRMAANLRPDLVVLDPQPPDLSGSSVVRSLRALPGLAQTPIVMATGNIDDLVEEVERLLSVLEPSGTDDAGLFLRRLY